VWNNIHITAVEGAPVPVHSVPAHPCANASGCIGYEHTLWLPSDIEVITKDAKRYEDRLKRQQRVWRGEEGGEEEEEEEGGRRGVWYIHLRLALAVELDNSGHRLLILIYP
jgi:hypothetical protein